MGWFLIGEDAIALRFGMEMERSIARDRPPGAALGMSSVFFLAFRMLDKHLDPSEITSTLFIQKLSVTLPSPKLVR